MNATPQQVGSLNFRRRKAQGIRQASTVFLFREIAFWQYYLAKLCKWAENCNVILTGPRSFRDNYSTFDRELEV